MVIVSRELNMEENRLTIANRLWAQTDLSSFAFPMHQISVLRYEASDGITRLCLVKFP